MASRPRDTDYAAFFAAYVNLVPESDVLSALKAQVVQLSDLAATVPANREGYRYAAEKWSVREVFGHLIDAERVFGYRAFCISRGERASLPGFEENEYVAASRYDGRALADLVAEFALVRKANLTCLEHLTGGDWERRGTANDNPVTVLALAFIMAGHVRHHMNILRTKYGAPPAV